MQAQVPTSPYVGLWSRLLGFRPERLSELIQRRGAVRIALMRSTIHLVTASDCGALRPLVQPVLDRELARAGPFARAMATVDVAELITAGRAVLEERPRTPAELGRRLQARWPDQDATALAMIMRNRVPLVQVPPRGLWGASGRPVLATAESWLGRRRPPRPALAALIRRYLAAYGPATVADLQAFTGLSGLAAEVERLRPRLRTHRDDRDRELFDLPGARLPDPDIPAPPRFLPDYDNVLLAHADRGRIIPEPYRARVMAGIGRPAVLIDGFVRAFWKLERRPPRAALVVEPVERLPAEERAAVVAEGDRLLDFLTGEAGGEVRLAPGP